MFLEVIATNLEDCRILNQAGNVNRIELCENLEHGGFTPEYDVIKDCCEFSKIPIRIMVRSTDVNFYCDDDDEFVKMKNDISFIKTTKADGIVIGIITRNRRVDVEKIKELVKLARPLKVTFHRAFDEVEDKVAGVKELSELRVETVLTQGGLRPIMQNLDVLGSLKGCGVQIQGGSGVNVNNYRRLLEFCDAVHVGSAVREGRSWEYGVDLEELEKFK